ncbi:MAG TPA: hypothetical protein VGB55_14835 [Tepidisphaeraceae bacterium]|jgi:hypothetical protein
MAKKESKPHVTRTLGPIHFEDLDPHRFEDLVRQLAYDFRNWQSIESTGRGGADDGFDIRAYEVLPPPIAPESEDAEEDAPHPMDGNLWMIQCKREKELGPKRVESIVRDAVKPESPPYGYILAAPVHFSKASHDRFREELRSRNVMEFYLWGAGELEDLLYQPKNDRILFAFFGISLTSRRRSRTTEIRATVGIKNKLLRVLGDNPRGQSVLLRDLQDMHYPFKGEVRGFDKRPAWKEYSVVSFHPRGLIVSAEEHYAYFDKLKREWDFTNAVNIAPAVQDRMAGHNSMDQTTAETERLREAVKGFWELLPRGNRTRFVSNGFIKFESIVYIDDKGDVAYGCPHLFMDFYADRGPFAGRAQYLEINPNHNEPINGLKRVKIFPSKFPKPSFGTIHSSKFITVDESARSALRRGRGELTIYSAEPKYSFLKPRDVIAVKYAKGVTGEDSLVKITNIRVETGKDILSMCGEDPMLQRQIEGQLGQQLVATDNIQVLEAIAIYGWQIEQDRPVL